MIVKYTKEPNPLACGQAVLAMLCGMSAEEIISELSNDRETNLRTMRDCLARHSITIGEKIRVTEKSDLPDIAVLSLETPKCWHWSLYFHGVFFDPEYGILTDWPPSAARFYFEAREVE